MPNQGGYKVAHSSPGRIRIITVPTVFEYMVPRLECLSGIESVTGNTITQSVVIQYDQKVKQESEILLSVKGIFSDMKYQIRGKNYKKQLRWSLLAGGTLLLSFISRKIGSISPWVANLLELTGFGLTAYSVATHCDGQSRNTPSKTMHLDTITGLVSMLNIGSDRDKVFGGVFLTWLINFMEITGCLPITRQSCGVQPKLIYS